MMPSLRCRVSTYGHPRGITPWFTNAKDDLLSSSSWTPFVTTNFALSNTLEAVEKVYKRIFRLQYLRPEWTTIRRGAGTDSTFSMWTISTVPPMTIKRMDSTVCSGNGPCGLTPVGMGISVMKTGVYTLLSPRTNTADFGMVSDQIAIDYRTTSNKVNDTRTSYGTMELIAKTINGKYLASLGSVPLNKVGSGAWGKAIFAVPEGLQTIIRGDYSDLQFQFTN